MRQARRRGLRNKIIFRSRQKRFLHICVIHISFYVCDVLYENVLLYIVNVHTSYTWYVYIDTLRKQNNDSNARLALMRSITIIYSFYCYLSYYLTSGPLHTETFSCVFVLFTVNSLLFSRESRTTSALLETIQKRRKTFPCVRGLNFKR